MNRVILIALFSLFFLPYQGNTQQCVYEEMDIYPGSFGAIPSGMIVLGSYMYFKATDDINGTELWRHDGTSASMVADIRPGGLSSSPNNFYIWGTDLYFAANDGTNGTELFSYDGFTVTLEANINPGPLHSYPKDFVEFNGDLYFSADNGTNGTELYKFDGVTASLVADINPGSQSSFPTEIFAFGSNLFFKATDGVNGFELWMYDGVTVTMVDFYPGSMDGNPSELYDYAGLMVFRATDPTYGTELWTWDGSTFTMIDINPGAGNSNPTQFLTFGSDLIMRAFDSPNGYEFWKFDGTTPTFLMDIRPGSQGSIPHHPVVMGPKVYFTANDGTNGAELWEYDGTTVQMAYEVNPGSGDGFEPTSIHPVIVMNGWMYFRADNGSTGIEMYRFDGTNLELGKDIWAGGTTSEPGDMVAFNGKIYFYADGGTNGSELWVWNPDVDLDTTISVFSCGPYTAPSGTVYSAPGTQVIEDYIPSTVCPNCDSIITINLSISPPVYNIDTLSCGTYTSGTGITFSAEGSYSYTDTVGSVLYPGCDSISIVNLDIIYMSTSVTQFGNVLVAQVSGANYQWLDCNNGFMPISGANNQDYVATANGTYTVEITIGGCVDTSNCFTVTGIGIPENEFGNSVSIFPNPVQDLVTIYQDEDASFEIQLIDNLGNIIFQKTITEPITEIDLSNYAAGAYLFVLKNEEHTAIRKVIKE